MASRPRIRGMLTNESETYHLHCDVIVIGRGGDIQIEGDGVEDKHCILKFNERAQMYAIIDLNTTYGTTVNQERLDLCFRKLEHGDVIQFGKREKPLNFVVTSSPEKHLEITTNTSKSLTIGDFEELLNQTSDMCKTALERQQLSFNQQQQRQSSECQVATMSPISPGELKALSDFTAGSYRLPTSPHGLAVSGGIPVQMLSQQEQRNIQQHVLRTSQQPGPSYQPQLSQRQQQLIRQQQPKQPQQQDQIIQQQQQQNFASLLGKLDALGQGNVEARRILQKMQEVMSCKDESLSILSKELEKSKKENACLELQNEALINSVSRKYADCDGCRREDVMIQKDMENIKLKVKNQLNIEQIEELNKCVACMSKEIEKLKLENSQLKKCLRTADEQVSITKKASDDFQRAELLGRANIEKLWSQLELLKKPVLEMVNVFCTDEETGEPNFTTLDALCGVRGPSTSTPLGLSTITDTSKGSESVKKYKNDQRSSNVNQCLNFQLAQAPLIEDMERLVHSADLCIKRMKTMKCQKQLFTIPESSATDATATTPQGAPAPPSTDKKEKRKKKTNK